MREFAFRNLSWTVSSRNLAEQQSALLHFPVATAEDIRRLLSINVEGVFFCYKHAGLQMIKQGKGGRIIGASSMAGKQGARLDFFDNLSVC